MPLSAGFMKEVVKEIRAKPGAKKPDELTKGVAKFGTGLLIGPFKDIVVPLFLDWGWSFLSGILAGSREEDETDENPTSEGSPKEIDRSQPEGILFIDSINALLAIVRQYTELSQSQARLTMNRAFAMVRKKFKRFVILVSSEFHHEASWVATGMAESFLSDVEITLTSEPIAVPAGYEASRQGSVGYSIFKIIDKVPGQESSKLESRSFIRVVKSRKAANQSRRCAYDIVMGSGLTFYETYPGDGHILLFTENAQQKQVWDTFFREDLPELYPALRYEDFDRSSLQRIYMNQRRSRYVPSRTDLYVSSFDNYWVNWYGELCWRRAVAEGVEDSVGGPDKNPEDVAKLISAMHKSLMGRPDTLVQCLNDILEPNEAIVLKEVLIAFASLSRRSNCMKCFFCRFCWWVLRQIAKENQQVLPYVITRMSKKGKQAEHDPGTQTGAKPFSKYTVDPEEAKEIESILDRMSKSIDEAGCCQSSAVRALLNMNGEPPANVKQWMNELESAAYDGPSSSDQEMLNRRAEQISQILSQRREDPSEVLEALDETMPWMKSEGARRRLKKELLDCREKTEAGKIREILDRHLGCECRVEFWSYIDFVLSKGEDAIREKLKGMSTEGATSKLSEDKESPKRQEEEDETNKLRELSTIRQSLAKKTYVVLKALFTKLPEMLSGTQCGELGKPESMKDLWSLCTQERSHQALYRLMTTYHLILKKRNTYHFLSDIPEDRIRLFGERRSTIIKELEELSPDNKRPMHRPGLLFAMRDARSLISIPYNANVSFIVYRDDLLRPYIKRNLWKDGKAGEKFNDYVQGVLSLHKMLSLYDKPTQDLYSKFQAQGVEERVRHLLETNLKQYLDRKLLSQGPLQTWEEMTTLLQLMSTGDRRGASSPTEPSKRHFVIETQTLDTLLCTMLEFLWGCGGSLKIGADYDIEDEEKTKHKLFQALYLLTVMLHKGIIPGDSTLDVAHFANEYSVGRNKTTRRGNDWVFARQWYSTLVDLLTAEKKSTSPDDSAAPGAEKKSASRNDLAARGNESSPFLWQNRRAELGIMPIPISLSHFLEFGDAAKHVSCWGDWHLIMTKGSENTELGIDLVNSLMASQKICERAFQCAGVPTVEEFYTLYGDSRCLNLPERRYETPRMLSDITFSDLRRTFFANAFSRFSDLRLSALHVGTALARSFCQDSGPM